MSEKPKKAPDDAEDSYQAYLKARDQTYRERRHRLDDLAFKTSERYDQWVLTIAGGALAVSLTFLEKLCPHPLAPTWPVLLVVAWLFLTAAIVTAFVAIKKSREAIYRQIEIDDKSYARFRSTTTTHNPVGNVEEEEDNAKNREVERANTLSSVCTVLGILLLCAFAFLNVGRDNNQPQPALTPKCGISFPTNQPSVISNLPSKKP